MFCSFVDNRHSDMMCYSVSCLQILHLLSVAVCNIFVTRNLVRNADIVLLLLLFQFLLSDLPSAATGSVFFTSKLSTHISNILTMLYFTFPFFL